MRLTTYLGSFSRNEFLEAQTLAGISSLPNSKFFPIYLLPYYDLISERNEIYASLASDPPASVKEILDTEKQVVLMWSRIEPENKGMRAAIRAVARIRDDEKLRDNFLLVISGPDHFGLVGELEALIVELQLKDAVRIILPSESGEHGAGLFLRADWISLLSSWDGFPRTLREALVEKKYMIISQQTNFAELVTEFNLGFVLDNNWDETELAEVFSLVANSSIKFDGNFTDAERRMICGNDELLRSY